MASKMPGNTPEVVLSDKEITILGGVARGLTNYQIGRELWVEEQTVKYHLRKIYRKLGVTKRKEAVRAAYRLSIVDSPTQKGQSET